MICCYSSCLWLIASSLPFCYHSIICFCFKLFIIVILLLWLKMLPAPLILINFHRFTRNTVLKTRNSALEPSALPLSNYYNKMLSHLIHSIFAYKFKMLTSNESWEMRIGKCSPNSVARMLQSGKSQLHQL